MLPLLLCTNFCRVFCAIPSTQSSEPLASESLDFVYEAAGELAAFQSLARLGRCCFLGIYGVIGRPHSKSASYCFPRKID